MEKHPNNHHHSERLEKLEAKAHEEKSVAGHPMPAADIFKFVGLIAFFVIMIVVVVLVWPMIHELFEPGPVSTASPPTSATPAPGASSFCWQSSSFRSSWPSSLAR